MESGTHISNTRQAKAFALLSEEGIAKGVRRVTAVTADYALKAIEVAQGLDQEIDNADQAEGTLLEKVPCGCLLKIIVCTKTIFPIGCFLVFLKNSLSHHSPLGIIMLDSFLFDVREQFSVVQSTTSKIFSGQLLLFFLVDEGLSLILKK